MPAIAQTPADRASELTVTVRRTDGVTSTHTWTDDTWLEEEVQRVSDAGGGTLDFGPGVYQFDRGLRVKRIHNVHFRGSPGTVFRMRPLPEIGQITITATTAVASKTLEVNRPELLRVGHQYRVFRGDLKAYRIVEFEVKEINGSLVTAEWITNAQIKSFEPGMWVFPGICFLQGWECGDLSFSDIEFDGNIDVHNTIVNGKRLHGHTMHCGLLLQNRYISRGDDPPRLPGTRGLRVSRCVFRRLLGRAVTVYNMHDVHVNDCRFDDIGAEGVEVDHLATNAVISGCIFNRNGFGVKFNDCTDSVLANSVFRDCRIAVHITKVMKDADLNRRLVIQGNTIQGGQRAIGMHHCADSVISANVISAPAAVGIELRGEQINCTSNTLTGIKSVGILVAGKECRHDGNVIKLARGAPNAIAVSLLDQ